MIFRIKHESNFTDLANEMLNDKAISFKARGLLSFMLSMPNEWRFYRSEIKKHSNQDGGTAIGNAIKELIQAGYLTCKQLKDEQGKWQESEWEVRENPNKKPQQGKPSAGKPSAGNKPLLNTNRVNTNSNKAVLESKRNSLSFDPEELPGHFVKHPEVIRAWAEFVQHRKEIGHKLTPIGWKKITMELLHHSPEEIISAIDEAAAKGWRKPFFHNVGMVQNGAYPQGRVRCRPDTDTILSDDAQQLYNFAVGVLGESAIRKDNILANTRALKYFHKNNIPADAIYHLPWHKFFGDWLTFLKEKQPSFPLQNAKQLSIGGIRWNEYIRKCEHYTSYSFVTGKWIGG